MAILIPALLVAISLCLPPSLSLSLSGPIYEEGYSVKTVLQAYKLGIKPYHICADVTGNSIFVLDSVNNNIHKFSLPLSEGSSMDLVAGSSKGKAGYVDSEPQLSLFDKPRSLAIDATGNLYIADKNNHAVRKCTHKGITTIAGGNKAKTGHNDGPGENSTFSYEFNVHYVSQMDSILVTDIGNKMIRQIHLDYSSNEVKLTQSVESGYAVETIFDGQKLDIVPSSVSNSIKGNDLFLLDKPHSNISKLSLPLNQSSTVGVVAGSSEGSSGYVDGEPKVALFSRPQDLATDTRGNVYVADGLNCAIRKINYSDGYVTTIAGGTSPGKTDGMGRTAKFSRDLALLFVPHMCCILVTDRGNQLIREIKLKPVDCASKSTISSGILWKHILLVASLAIGALIVWALIAFRQKARIIFSSILSYAEQSEIAEIFLAILTSLPRLVWTIFLFIRSYIPLFRPKINSLQAQNPTPLQKNKSIDHEKDLIDFNTILDGPNDLVGSSTTEEGSVSSDHHVQDKIDIMREKYEENFVDESRQV